MREEYRQRYLHLLAQYVEAADERYLLDAADLGREFVGAGVPAEEITELHEFALAETARERSMSELAKIAFASQPFMEVMMAYSLEFRRQAEARLGAERELRRANEELERRVLQLEIVEKAFQALPIGVSIYSLQEISGKEVWKFVLGNPLSDSSRELFDPQSGSSRLLLEQGRNSGGVSFSDACADVVRRNQSVDFGVATLEDEGMGTLYLHARAFPLPGDHLGLFLEDVSDRRKLEAQVRQSQKMDAVGRLAGGVAHDFNNVLTTIFNFAEFAAEEVGADNPVYEDLQEVLRSAERAAAITRQLLSFSRKQSFPQVIDPNAQLREIDRMLQSLMQEGVAYQAMYADDLWNTLLDPGAFEQVIINLAINARDALGRDGGSVKLETRNLVVDGLNGALGVALDPGDYVVIAVSDDGSGIDPAIQQRVFEPFFTTKDPGKGTGLGLAISLDIVAGAGGIIDLESRVGHGTTVRVFLPRSEGDAEKRDEEAKRESPFGSEIVLVVEDDTGVRISACRALRASGYEVLSAVSGVDGWRIFEEHQPRPQLLLTDVVMPEMGGRELAARVHDLAPEVPILFMSGYTGEASPEADGAKPGSNLIQKPFSAEVLVRKVREVLDRARNAEECRSA